MKTTEKKIEKLQKKVQNFKNKIEDEIYEICENLKYQDSCRFSYNIDHLEHFVNKLNDFKISNK